MSGRSGIYTVLILVISALAACSSPVGIGIVGGSSGGGIANSTVYEGLEAAVSPSRTYKAGDLFQRSHLSVTTLYRGERQAVPLGECDVFIEEAGILNPVTASGYELKTVGTKSILVEWVKYGLQGRCSIVVGEADGGGNGGSDVPTGIVIIWP